MDSIKERKGMDLTESEDIKKRWQEYTEELDKKDLHDPDNQTFLPRSKHLLISWPQSPSVVILEPKK